MSCPLVAVNVVKATELLEALAELAPWEPRPRAERPLEDVSRPVSAGDITAVVDPSVVPSTWEEGRRPNAKLPFADPILENPETLTPGVDIPTDPTLLPDMLIKDPLALVAAAS